MQHDYHSESEEYHGSDSLRSQALSDKIKMQITLRASNSWKDRHEWDSTLKQLGTCSALTSLTIVGDLHFYQWQQIFHVVGQLPAIKVLALHAAKKRKMQPFPAENLGLLVAASPAAATLHYLMVKDFMRLDSGLVFKEIAMGAQCALHTVIWECPYSRTFVVDLCKHARHLRSLALRRRQSISLDTLRQLVQRVPMLYLKPKGITALHFRSLFASAELNTARLCKLKIKLEDQLNNESFCANLVCALLHSNINLSTLHITAGHVHLFAVAFGRSVNPSRLEIGIEELVLREERGFDCKKKKKEIGTGTAVEALMNECIGQLTTLLKHHEKVQIVLQSPLWKLVSPEKLAQLQVQQALNACGRSKLAMRPSRDRFVKCVLRLQQRSNNRSAWVNDTCRYRLVRDYAWCLL